MYSYILASFKLRLAFVHVSVKPFFGIFGLEELLLQFALKCECRLKCHLRATLHCPFDFTNSQRRFVRRRELRGAFMDHLCKLFSTFRFKDLSQDIKFKRALKCNQLTGRHQLYCLGLPDKAHQTLRAARTW